MPLEAKIDVYAKNISLNLKNNKSCSNYLLPVPDSINYDSNWTGVSLVYANPNKMIERKIDCLATEKGWIVNQEPKNMCGHWSKTITIPQCSKVSICDKGRVKEIRKTVIGK